jgi:hypothetical protein
MSGPLLLPRWADLAEDRPVLVATMRRYLTQIACTLRPGSVGCADVALRCFAAFLAEAEVSAFVEHSRLACVRPQAWDADRVSTFEISGWVPNLATAEAQIADHAADLRSVVGRRVIDAWIAWDLEHDRWFADLPVVLELDSQDRLELSWQKFDDLSITWNSIDVSIAPKAWVTWPLEWRVRAHPALAAFVGNVVESVEVTHHRFTTVRAAHPEQEPASTWLAGGIWFGASTGLHVFNALDENGLSNDAVPSDNRTRSTTI